MDDADADFARFAGVQTPRLLGLAYTMTGNPHDAWDLVQETLVRVGVRWNRLRDEEPGAYARTVIVRLNIDRIRRLRRELLVRHPADRESPVVEVGGAAPWLFDGLAQLTPRQRTALALRFVEDLDVAGIADRMQCSVGTAKSHLSRGLQRLRDHPAAIKRNEEMRTRD
jgi:RNA polymerase sigma-70 factor (sigma-E family)